MIITPDTTRAQYVAHVAGITAEQAEKAIEAVGQSVSTWGVGWLVAGPGHEWVRFQDIPVEEKKMLRPVAETLAMLEGNAFFGMDAESGVEHYEYYLPEAKALFDSNGGLSGWAGEASFAKPFKDGVAK